MGFKFFETKRLGKIEVVYFLNEQHASAQTWVFFTELAELIENIEKDETVCVTIFAGKGDHFSAGLDFNDFFNHFGHLIGNDSKKLYETIKIMQKGMNFIFNGKKIYIAAVSGYCIGGGLDFISACDLRFCTQDAIFSLKETKLGITADLGSLQRLPFIIGFDNTRILAFSGKNIDAKTAKRINLVSDVFDDKEQLISEVLKISQSFTENPKNALFGTKKFINSLIEETINTQLDKIAQFNAKSLSINDIRNNLPKIFKKEQ